MESLGVIGSAIGQSFTLAIFVWIWNQRDKKIESLGTEVEHLKIKAAVMEEKLKQVLDKK